MRSSARRAIAVTVLVALALGAGASESEADVVTGERTELALIAVDRVSSTATPEETEQVWRQANASLQGDRDLYICLESARVRRGARGSVSATLVFDRAREPRVTVAVRGAIPASARRCIQTATAAVWLRAAPAGRVTLRARFEIVTFPVRNHRPDDRPDMPF